MCRGFSQSIFTIDGGIDLIAGVSSILPTNFRMLKESSIKRMDALPFSLSRFLDGRRSIHEERRISMSRVSPALRWTDEPSTVPGSITKHHVSFRVNGRTPEDRTFEWLQ